MRQAQGLLRRLPGTRGRGGQFITAELAPRPRHPARHGRRAAGRRTAPDQLRDHRQLAGGGAGFLPLPGPQHPDQLIIRGPGAAAVRAGDVLGEMGDSQVRRGAIQRATRREPARRPRAPYRRRDVAGQEPGVNDLCGLRMSGFPGVGGGKDLPVGQPHILRRARTVRVLPGLGVLQAPHAIPARGDDLVGDRGVRRAGRAVGAGFRNGVRGMRRSSVGTRRGGVEGRVLPGAWRWFRWHLPPPRLGLAVARRLRIRYQHASP